MSESTPTDQTDPPKRAQSLTDSLTATRPGSLSISPASSMKALNCIDQDPEDHTDSGSSAADGYLDEHLNISKLMSEYAENDKHYDGVVGPVCVTTPQGPRPILQEGPPRPILRCISDADPDVCKDGPRMNAVKKTMGKVFMALRFNKGLQELSIASNQPPEQTCLYVYHHSGKPSPGLSLLSLKPDQSPQLKPVYDPSRPKHFDQVISYTLSMEKASPGADAVKVESKTHVYLALDYTDEDKPKLLTLEEEVLETMLTKANQGTDDRKIKPIVNVRQFRGDAGLTNNTAFYFKTEKNYHFVTVNEETLHLDVKTVPASKHDNSTYRNYLTFGPTPLNDCPASQKVAVDGSESNENTPRTEVTKSAIVTSPMSDLGTNDSDNSENFKRSNMSSPDSTPSDFSPPIGKFKFDKTAADSGVDEGSKESQELGEH